MGIVQLDDNFYSPELREFAAREHQHAHKLLSNLVASRDSSGEMTGWFNFPEKHGFSLAEDIESFRDQLPFHYDVVVVVGIGGSYLGTKAIAKALSHAHADVLVDQSKTKQLLFAGNSLSERDLVELIDVLAEKDPIVNVVSKSGTTTEPGIAFRVLQHYLVNRYGPTEASKRIVATTDPSSGALRTLAQAKKIKTFDVPKDVGGRFSVLTAVGLVPLGLAGFAIKPLLHGAHCLFKELIDLQADAGHAVLDYATRRYAAHESGKAIEVLAVSEPRLNDIVEWWKQLFGESEGKQGKGLFPAGVCYSTDLHSLGQYLQDGQRTMLETFLTVKESGALDERNIERRIRVPRHADSHDGMEYLEERFVADVNEAALRGTMLAHSDGKVPCLELQIQRLDMFTIGALVAFFQSACAISAGFLGVDPFDQPGVEAYKQNLFALLDRPGFEDQAKALKSRLRVSD